MTDQKTTELRLLYSDPAGLGHETHQREMSGQICAMVGPIGDFTSHPDLQDALALVVMAFNRRNGNLSEQKHRDLVKKHEGRGGSDLLRSALEFSSDRTEE